MRTSNLGHRNHGKATSLGFSKPVPLSSGEMLDPAWKISDLVEEYLIRCELRGFSPKTVQLYGWDLNPFVGFLSRSGVAGIGAVGAHHIEGFLRAAKERGCSAHSMNRLFRNLRAFFNDLSRRFDGCVSPVARVTAPRCPTLPPKAVTLEHIQHLISACRTKGSRGRRDALFIRFVFDTGFRRAEALSIRLEDIDLTSGTILLRCGKGGQPRAVIVGQRTLLELRRYIRSLPTGATFLFPGKGGTKPIEGERMRRRLNALGAEVGVKVTPHRLRFSCAVSMLMDGADVHTVAARLGHRTAGMTLHYSRLYCQDTLERGKRFSPGDRL